MSMKKRIKSSILVLTILLLLTSALLVNKVSFINAQSKPITYINTAEEFKNAIINRQETIFVDDITFENLETIVLNYTVKIVGKSEKSTIKNLRFNIYGSLNFEDKIKITLKNIKFDGCFDRTAYDLTQEKSFNEVFGEENDNGFLSVKSVDIGYYDIDINCCEFTNYIGEWGAVISLPTNKSNNDEKLVSIKNSKFYGNVGAERIVDIFDSQIKLDIKNVEMYDNYAVSKMANFTNVSLNVDGFNVHDNHFIPLDSLDYYEKGLIPLNDRNMIRGGGVYFGNAKGIVKNMTVVGNETYYGGGIFIALSLEGNKTLTFADCIFKNNKAKVYGGAVGVESYHGYPVYFTNCQFLNNQAPQGGSVCAMPFLGDDKDGNTSLIEFSFCDFSCNIADDDKSLGYYLDGFTKTKTDGKIVVKACRIEDATFLSGSGEKENNYNVVSITAVADNHNIQVPLEEYILWANGYYSGKTEQKKVGYIQPTILQINVISPVQPTISQTNVISPIQPIFYGLCAVVSIFIALFYLFKSTEKHIEMILITIAVAVINVGYLLLSISNNITSALLFNNLAYLGNAFLPLFFLMAVANVCRYKVKKISKIILSIITIVNFLFTTTVWFSGLFYVEPTYAIIKGAVDIVKTNGILHLIYMLYVFSYFFIIFGVVLYSLLKKRLEHKKYGILIFSAEFVCLLVWIGEMFVSYKYEHLSIAFTFTSLLLSVLFFEMEKYGILNISEIVYNSNLESETNNNSNIQIIDANGIELICDRFIENNVLSRRETEILALLLQGKSSSAIAEIVFVSKNTIKSHTANIYKKLSVKNRDELRYRVISEIQK